MEGDRMMPKSALSELQEQIEAVRREAFAAGFAAAMQSIREFTAQPASGVETIATARPRRARSAAPAQSASLVRRRQPRAIAKPTQRIGHAPTQRLQRGTNA